jgi:hypothetical protein
MGNLNKSKETMQTVTAALKVEDHYPPKLKSPFWTKLYLVKVPLNVKIVQQDLLHRIRKQFLKIL